MKYLSGSRMQRIALGAMFALVVACAGQTPRQGGGLEADGVVGLAQVPRADTPGPTVAQHLTDRYQSTAPNCKKTSTDPNPLPAVLCSGILLRATKRGAGYYVWNPNPGSSTPNGVPFSWLRRDSGFSSLVFNYTNGFIILPVFFADDPADGYTQLIVRCVFPFDGATNNRTGGDRDGCGQYGTQAGTGPCQPQGITTAAQWLAKFQNGGLYGNQCGFRLLPGTANAWQAFQAQTEIRTAMSSRFALHNEVIVGTWAQDDRKLPLEAFFYIAGGLAEAKANQVDFKTRTGRWVPVINIKLPTTPGGAATFTFNMADQGIQQ
ncbi:hypothetical protein HBF26_18760 [Luteibacter jiangsuensis]|uniref:Halovibrin HvnA n=1 Tax=Luteibacter jiangsuensis TaxID=637577 RepID=A0ABX0QBD6_9GAMM|nr:hypothetical protein [Luteibacter jiangsuensis]NID06936.1 hypothetical protein [Luteibacter jiangsuensis]